MAIVEVGDYRLKRNKKGVYSIVNRFGIKKSPVEITDWAMLEGETIAFKVNNEWCTLSDDGKVATKLEKAPLKIIMEEDGKKYFVDDNKKYLVSREFWLSCGSVYCSHMTRDAYITSSSNYIKIKNFSNFSYYDIIVSSDRKYIMCYIGDTVVRTPAKEIASALENNTDIHCVGGAYANMYVGQRCISEMNHYIHGKPLDYRSGYYICRNEQQGVFLVDTKGAKLHKDIINYSACGQGFVIEKMQDGEVVKLFSIKGKDVVCDNVQYLGFGYYAYNNAKGKYHIMNEDGKNIADNIQFDDIEYASSANSNSDKLINIVCSEYHNSKKQQRIVSIYQDEDNTRIAMSRYYSEISNGMIDSVLGYICKSEIVSDDESVEPEVQYQWVSTSVGMDGEIDINESEKYAYMGKDFTDGMKNLYGFHNICVQTEKCGSFHMLKLDRNAIDQTSLSKQTKSIICTEDMFGRLCYRDTLGRLTDEIMESSEEFNKYHSGRIALVSLKNEYFADPYFMEGILETEKQKYQRQLDKATTSKEYEQVVKDAKNRKLLIYSLKQDYYDKISEQIDNENSKAQAVDDINDIFSC